jgi:spermidine/putrescine-binding protein
MDYHIVIIDKYGFYENIAIIKGSNAEKRAQEYVKQILLPDKQQMYVVSQAEYSDHNSIVYARY